TVGVLLAAGRSRRFGAANKLLAPLSGKPLVGHAAAALARVRLEHYVAVVRSSDVAAVLTGFDLEQIPEEQESQSDSLRAGIARAARLGASGVLVCLGDMPRVSVLHLEAVVSLGRAQGIAASSQGGKVMPPAWFDSVYFSELEALEGDQGARAILRSLPLAARVSVQSDELVDIDRPEDLHRFSG
ncbi:MAG: nucleotidyltransferase family protein, partial [Pseudomonadota bacterium]